MACAPWRHLPLSPRLRRHCRRARTPLCGRTTSAGSFGSNSTDCGSSNRSTLQEAALSPDDLTSAVRSALDATGHPESRIRLTLAPPRFFLSVEPFTPLPSHLREEGVACITVPLHRDRPHAKDTRFIATAAQVYAALPEGVHEALMVDEDDAVLEGLSSNFFAVLDGELRTEAERALLGVTRSLVVEVAGGLLPVRQTAILRTDLVRVAECFITSVSREVLSVTRIDGAPVGDGRPGPMTREVVRRFADLVAREAQAV